MTSNNKNSLFFEGVLIAGALLLILIKTINRNTENIKEFFYHELPPWLLSTIITGFIVYWFIKYLILLDIENKKRWNKEAKEYEEQEEKEQKKKESMLDDTLRSELHNLTTSHKDILTGENTTERKKALQNVLNLAKNEKYNREALLHDKITLLTPFKQAIREIDNALDRENKRKEENIDELNFDEGVYPNSEITEDQQEALQEEGFQKLKCVGLDDNRTFNYWIKPRANESPQHYFLVKSISNYLKQKEIDHETPNSRDADIIIKQGEKLFAIEVETGSYPKSKPQEFLEKIEKNNKKYGDNWIIVVTNTELVKEYQKHNTKTYNRLQIKEVIDNWTNSGGEKGEDTGVTKTTKTRPHDL